MRAAILHLSDLHLTRLAVSDLRQQRTELCDKLRAFVQERAAVELVVVSGDLVDKGNGDFAPVTQWLGEICAAAAVGPDRVFMVPGNHDVARQECDTNARRLVLAALKNRTITSPGQLSGIDANVFGPGFRAWSRFASTYPLLKKNPVFPLPGFAAASPTLAGVEVCLCGLNTALTAGAEDSGNEEARDRVLLPETLRAVLPRRALPTIVVSHYPVSWLVDFEREEISSCLQHAKALVLTGHVHTPMDIAAGIGHEMIQLGAGTAIAKGWNGENHCQLIELDRSSGTTHLHEWLWSADHGWRAIEPLNVPWSGWSNYCRTNPAEPGPPDATVVGRRATTLGLADVALRRTELIWPPYANNGSPSAGLDELIDDIVPGSEYFLVARSLEAWIRRGPGSKTYLYRLAQRARRDGLRCVLVLPEQGIKSLVLSDPSQGAQNDLWNTLETELMQAFADIPDVPPDSQTGFVKVYTIPAYVPSTFSRLHTRKGGEYCTLEVGIGIALEEGDRALLYFRKTKEKRDAYSTLKAIHLGLIDERTPKLTFPSEPEVPAESRGQLEQIYKRLQSEPGGVRSFVEANWDDNRDWVNPKDWTLRTGEAAAIATAPIRDYIGGGDLTTLAKSIRTKIERALGGSSKDTLAWYGDDIHVPIFHYKSTFQDRFNSPFDGNESRQLVACVGSHSQFVLRFERFVIDRLGRIMLLGFAGDDHSLKTLSDLRSALFNLAKIEHRRFDARRPDEIACLLGHLTRTLQPQIRTALGVMLDEQDLVSPERYVDLEVDQLRLIAYRGRCDRHEIVEIGEPMLLSTPLQENRGDEHDAYGVIAKDKWLAHAEIVERVKQGTFKTITPITVHFSPSFECPYQCPTCSYGSVKERPVPAMMGSGQIQTCLNKLKDGEVKAVIFTGGGEPLTNESTISGLQHAKRIGLSTGLFTNGYLLTPNKAEALLEKLPPDFVRFSINAGTRAAYQLVHGAAPDAFDRVIGNLTYLCELKYGKKEQDPAKRMSLSVGVLITPAVEDNLLDLTVELKRIALKYPGSLNGVIVRPAVRYANGCRRNEFADALMSDPKVGASYRAFIEDREQLDEGLLTRGRAIVDSKVRPCLDDGTASSVQVSYPTERWTGLSLEKRPFDACLARRLVAFVAPDAKLYSCVERALENGFCVGDLTATGTLAQMYQNYGDTLNCTDCPPVCLLYETNRVWNEMAGQTEQVRGHKIGLAQKYFERHICRRIGNAVNFI